LPLVVILLFSIRGVSRFVSSYYTAKIGVTVANALRKRIFSHLIQSRYAAMQKITTGDINALIIQTVLNIQNVISKAIPQLIISLLTIVALVIVILYSDWRLALYAIAVGVLTVIPVKILGKGVKRHTKSSESMISQMSNRINESFNNLDLVKVYGAQKHEESRFGEFIDEYETFQIKLSKYQLLSSPFMEFFIALAIAVVIYIGGHFVVDGSMTPGDFFAFMVALMMLYAPIKNLTQNSMILYMLNSYVQRVEEMLSLPIESDKDDTEKPGTIRQIRFDNVGYAIDNNEILKEISFEINSKDRVAIVGKSGAGKSSIVALIAALAKPTEGKIEINSRSIDEISTPQIRHEISYVNQQAGIFNDTIEANIRYGKEMNLTRYRYALQTAECGFVEHLPQKDQTLAGEFGHRLSGGQRQRIALARAIYAGGSLFILDEATSALDADTERLISNALDQATKEKTTIIVAHRLASIQKCNKVIVLQNGQIVEYGSYDEVSQSEAFRRNFMVGEF